VATDSKVASHRLFWRIVLLVLVVLPLLPEILVLSVSAVANLSGCRVYDEAPTVNNWRHRTSTLATPPPGGGGDAAGRRSVDTRVPPDPWMVADLPATGSDFGAPVKVCAIGPLPPVSSIIRFALNAGFLVGDSFGSGVVIIWLTLCYIAISRGWAGFLSRLLVALVVSLIFAIVPYLGPMMSIEHLENPGCQPNEDGVGPCIIYGGEVGSIVNRNIKLGWKILTGGTAAFAALALYILTLLIARLATWASAGRWLRSKS
jgi:hypothetical protein